MGIRKSCLPHSITLLHKMGESDGASEYDVSIFRNVRLEQRIAITQKLRGQKSYDTFKIYIDPKNSEVSFSGVRKNYIPYHTFRALQVSERTDYWTLEEGDYVIPDILETDINRLDISELKHTHRVFTVNAFVPVYGKRGLHHWEVSGRGKIWE